MEDYEFIVSLAITVVAIAGLLWRFEVRFSDLSDRVSRIEGRLEGFATKADIARMEGLIEGFATRADIARMEGMLEGYFVQASKKDN